MPDRPFIPARETLYRGIKMRSRLEAKFATMLDLHGITWEYEGQAFGSVAGQYLPDFRVTNPQSMHREGQAGDRYYIEVKPYLPDAAIVRMNIIRETDPDAILAIATPPFGTLLACADAKGCFLAKLVAIQGEESGILRMNGGGTTAMGAWVMGTWLSNALDFVGWPV